MKKLFIAVLLLFPTLTFAQTFDTNLSYGSTGSDVTALQEFLTAQHVYSGPISGNFFSLTLAGVKAFQTAESITPVSGFVGPITRLTINTLLTQQAPTSEGNASTSTPPVDLSLSTTTVPVLLNKWYTTPITQPLTPPIVEQTQNTPTPTIPVRNPPEVTATNVITTNTSIIPAGTTGMTMASIGLEVSAGDENVRLYSVPLTLTLNNGAKASDLSNCQLWAYGASLTNGHLVNGSRLSDPNSLNASFDFNNLIIINSGLEFSMTVQCDISPSAVSGGSYAWNVNRDPSFWNLRGAYYDDSLAISFAPALGDTITIQ